MLVVVDYGMGNLRSVAKALEFVAPEAEVLVSADPDLIRRADRIVLPGQSAMPDCMRCVADSGLTEVLREGIARVPFLGICLGLQMLFDRSEEGQHKVSMSFVDDDGRSIMPSIDMPVQVDVPGESIFVSRNFIINIQQMKFERPGHYAIGILVDGRMQSSVPLHVKLAPAEPESPS